LVPSENESDRLELPASLSSESGVPVKEKRLYWITIRMESRMMVVNLHANAGIFFLPVSTRIPGFTWWMNQLI
jgi:hypothetical protein